MHEGNPYPGPEYRLARQLLQEWYSEYMNTRLLEILEEGLLPSDQGRPDHYPLPTDAEWSPEATPLSDAEWADQNRRINNLLYRGVADP